MRPVPSRIRLSAVGLVLLFSATLSADEVTIDGYSNYYKVEGKFDWAKKCRLVADLPQPGTQLPAPVRLRFTFEHDQERLAVFNYYSARTRFDLGFYTSTSPFTYIQLGKFPAVSSGRATVTFDSFDLTAPPGATSELKLEIYGDCTACSTSEALPPNNTRTTWRIFATIAVTTNAAGQVVTCRLTSSGSEEPAKELPSRDPRHYPARKTPRPVTYEAPSTLLGSDCAGQPDACNGPCQPTRRCANPYANKCRTRR
jgi:hypothetical protein